MFENATAPVCLKKRSLWVRLCLRLPLTSSHIGHFMELQLLLLLTFNAVRVLVRDLQTLWFAERCSGPTCTLWAPGEMFRI